jgi:hypothetical protein
MLTYPLDLQRPYTILAFNPKDDTYRILGIAKTLKTHISGKTVEFGGHSSIFVLQKDELLSKAQKAQLRWVKKHLGERQHDVIEYRLYDLAIANHSINLR